SVVVRSVRLIRIHHMFRSLFSILVWMCSCLITVAADDSSRWQLVWQDEFAGKTLDPSKWEFEVNARGGGNNELQYYLTNNVQVKDGLLFIEARKQHYTGPEGTRNYTSSRIRT